jgi:hypothetical protein
MAPEVLNLPEAELMQWASTIGARYASTLLNYWPQAKEYALKSENLHYRGPEDDEFNRIMFETCLTRFLRFYGTDDHQAVAEGQRASGSSAAPTGTTEMYDFRAMELIKPMFGYCAPTRVFIKNTNGKRTAVGIEIAPEGGQPFTILPNQPAWRAAKIFALQGASYHILFVVHPALHFPLDSINAITKTSVPMQHALLQLLLPHSTYQLTQDNAVLEGQNSPVNEDFVTCWFDPFMARGYDLKLLFAAGYTGLSKWPQSYPPYNYMTLDNPIASDYGFCLAKYSPKFEQFGNRVAEWIGARPPQVAYVNRWADYNHAQIPSFPDAYTMSTKKLLGRVLGLYMFDVSVSHGADHFSFSKQVSVRDKFLRVNITPPQRPEDPFPSTYPLNADDLFRAAMTQELFFRPYTLSPSLIEVVYALPADPPGLRDAVVEFKNGLMAVDEELISKTFQPLVPRTVAGMEAVPYTETLPASIQY